MKKFPNFIIKKVSLSDMPFTTAGHWKETKEGYEIMMIEFGDWRYFAIGLMHELAELFWCIQHGVTTKEADKFDALWEKELKQGKHKPETEAGFDKRCPYRGGHVLGSFMEKMFCRILGIRWKKYSNDWDKFFKEHSK